MFIRLIKRQIKLNKMYEALDKLDDECSRLYNICSDMVEWQKKWEIVEDAPDMLSQRCNLIYASLKAKEDQSELLGRIISLEKPVFAFEHGRNVAVFSYTICELEDRYTERQFYEAYQSYLEAKRRRDTYREDFEKVRDARYASSLYC